MKHMLWQCPRRLPGPALCFCLFVSFSSTSTAQQVSEQAPNAISSRERTLAAESFATERLYQWQKRLNLEDWKISVAMARTTELRPRTLGNIHWDLAKKTAVIHVLDPADYHMALHAMLDDMEFTVVHELLHLGFAPVLADLQRTEANRREEEHTVNHMAEALLRLERGK
jgi:membrane protein required for beta-lactamase induction